MNERPEKSASMNRDKPAECCFHIVVLAPAGLAGIESHLAACRMNLKPYRSGFNGHVILRSAMGEERFEFDMDASTTAEMHASGQLYLSEHESWDLLASLSEALKRANFPHSIGMDDTSGNLFRRIRHEMPESTG